MGIGIKEAVAHAQGEDTGAKIHKPEEILAQEDDGTAPIQTIVRGCFVLGAGLGAVLITALGTLPSALDHEGLGTLYVEIIETSFFGAFGLGLFGVSLWGFWGLKFSNEKSKFSSLHKWGVGIFYGSFLFLSLLLAQKASQKFPDIINDLEMVVKTLGG